MLDGAPRCLAVDVLLKCWTMDIARFGAKLDADVSSSGRVSLLAPLVRPMLGRAVCR
jgi:hypothetical protein